MSPSIQFFPELSALQGLQHAFLARFPGIPVETDRATALEALRPAHEQALGILNLSRFPLVTCEQVHGSEIAAISSHPTSPHICFPGADALISNQPDTVLGIYVADCCAVFLFDPVTRAIGLAHSGAKGTRLGIVPQTIRALHSQFGSDPANLVALLSPCIRPPWYEVDFAAEIRAQCAAEGIQSVFDSGVCTASDPDRFYSYRREMGKTGRMLALLSLRSGSY